MKYILYHANCDDGFGAAWSAWKALGDDAKYIALQYGEGPAYTLSTIMNYNERKSAEVFFIDVTFSRNGMEYFAEECESVLVLDHHISAQKELGDLPYTRFDMNKSGATLSWNHFNPSTPTPKLIKYIQDRDLWQKELLNSEKITAWIRSFPRDFNQWNTLEFVLGHDDGFINASREGNAILRAQEKYINERLSQAYETVVVGHTVLTLNETQHFSEIAGELAKHPDYLFGSCFFIRSDGKEQWSLRSYGDFDVSEIAKKMGGGGHRNAAGFIK